MNNRAQCLRNIAMVAASKIMDSSADLDNFITEPDFEWGGLVAEAIGLAIYFYIEIGQTLAVTVTTILKTVFPVLRFPPISFALGAFVTAMFTKYRLMAVGAGVVGGLIPGIGDELQRIGMTAAGMSQNEWVNRVQQIAGAQFAMQRAAMAAIGGNLTQSAQEYAANAATSMATAALTKLATKGAGVASEEVQKVVNESVARIVEDRLGEMDELYLASVTQLVPKAKFRGRGKDDWDVGSPGRDRYALDRKLWVNRELQKGKFAKDAACTGFWNVTYHDKPNPNAKPDAGPEDCTIL